MASQWTFRDENQTWLNGTQAQRIAHPQERNRCSWAQGQRAVRCGTDPLPPPTPSHASPPPLRHLPTCDLSTYLSTRFLHPTVIH